VTGVSAEFPLPPLSAEPFPAWMQKHGSPAGERGEVVLFATCYGDYNLPCVSRAAVRVLEHQGYGVSRTEQGCCGMPNLDGGDVEAMKAKVRDNVRFLYPAVSAGKKIVVPGPTCGYTMKKEWPVYVDTPEVRAVAHATMDLMEFLDSLRKAKTLKKDFQTSLGSIAYHAACHLRAQKIAFPGMRVLSLVPDTDIRMIEQCSAVDGTWGMKAVHYEMGRNYARKLTRAVAEVVAALVLSDCPLSALRIEKENGVPVMHPVQALARAYGLALD
jgi:glycerol-3-phosphate dehydrogenase subunit C